MNKIEKFRVDLLKKCIKNINFLKIGLSQPFYSQIVEPMKKIDELRDKCRIILNDLCDLKNCEKIDNININKKLGKRK